MLKIKILLCFYFISVFLHAQKITYPTIPKTAVKWQGFIPNGWEILDTATGDLNKDGWKDVAMALQLSKPIYYYKREISGFIDTNKTQPRIFILSFYNKKTKLFDRYLLDTTIVERNDSTMNGVDFVINYNDPFENISIQKGLLIVDTHFGTSVNRNSTNYTYKFRFQKNVMALIGAEYLDYTSGHDETRIDFNFSTGKYIKTGENGLSGIKQKTIYGKIKAIKIPTLNHWHGFEPIKGVEL